MIMSDINEKQQTILIVDDSITNIKVLAQALAFLNLRLLVAKSGQEAIKIALDNQPDLILLDIMMPEMDGYEVCKKLKEIPETINIPIIFVSAKTHVEDETKGLELGAVDYISKPISKPIVRARIKNHLLIKRQRDTLEKICSIDGLTGIANRRKFDELLEHEWKRAMRSNGYISLIMIDIDYFKAYNDNYGHAKGDECLKKVSQTLKKTLQRGTDLVARYGGEEFVCLLPMTDKKGVLVNAIKLREEINMLEIPHEFSKVKKILTISQGCATMRPTNCTNSKILIEKADKALYKSKKKGRDQINIDETL